MLQKFLKKKSPPSSSSSSSSSASSRHSHARNCSSRSSSDLSTSSAISSLRSSHLPSLYRFSELSISTNNFSASHKISPSIWRASLRSRIVAISRRHGSSPRFHRVLRCIHSLHHSSIVKLLGACRTREFLYLVYEFIDSANLGDCLSSKHCPGYSALSSWHSRMQIVVDVAKGIEYLHHHCHPTIIHKNLSSRNVLVSNDYRAKISDVGVSALTGEVDIFQTEGGGLDDASCEISPPSYEDYTSIEHKNSVPIEHKFTSRDHSIMSIQQNSVARDQSCRNAECNSDVHERKISRNFSSIKISGIQGYMPPEYMTLGELTLKYDVYAFGVILAEILSGKNAVVPRLSRQAEKKSSLPEMLQNVMKDPDPRGRLRLFIDPLLHDSYPLDDVLKVAAIAVSCLDSDPSKRPQMSDVASNLQKYLASAEKYQARMMSHSEMFSSSLKPR